MFRYKKCFSFQSAAVAVILLFITAGCQSAGGFYFITGRTPASAALLQSGGDGGGTGGGEGSASAGSPSDGAAADGADALGDRMLLDGWDTAALDTARDADYLSEAEKDVFLATNALRSDPGKFAETFVAEVIGFYQGKRLQYPGEITIMTNEGAAPARELYGELLKAEPLGLIRPSRGLSAAAADHAAEQAADGKTGHYGRGGVSPVDRINRYGRWDITAGENICYGFPEGLRIVLHLAIDDGVPGRGHRENLLNPDFAVAGVGIDSHSVYRHSCTIDYAGAYEEK